MTVRSFSQFSIIFICLILASGSLFASGKTSIGDWDWGELLNDDTKYGKWGKGGINKPIYGFIISPIVGYDWGEITGNTVQNAQIQTMKYGGQIGYRLNRFAITFAYNRLYGIYEVTASNKIFLYEETSMAPNIYWRVFRTMGLFAEYLFSVEALVKPANTERKMTGKGLKYGINIDLFGVTLHLYSKQINWEKIEIGSTSATLSGDKTKYYGVNIIWPLLN